MRVVAACAFMLALCAGCAGPAKKSELVLPFHVAVVPIELALPFDPSEVDQSTQAKRLSVEPVALSKHLAATLGKRCFTRATLLEPPHDLSREEFAGWSTQQRDAYWITAGAAAGADLIATGELRVGRMLEGEINEKFWLNLPLFVCGGPACYFVDDRTYQAEARLDVWIFDLPPLAARQASIDDGRAELAHVQSRFHGATLDFWDRAGADAGSLAESILIPAGLLARNGARVDRAVAAKAVAELVEGVRSELQSESMDVLVAKRLSDFYVDPRSILLSENGFLRFRGDVILRRGEIERIDTWRLQAGADSLEGELQEAIVDTELTTAHSRFVRYPIDVQMPAAPNCQEATLTIVSAGRNPMRRTFTFAVATH